VAYHSAAHISAVGIAPLACTWATVKNTPKINHLCITTGQQQILMVALTSCFHSHIGSAQSVWQSWARSFRGLSETNSSQFDRETVKMGICARELFLRTVAPMFVCACLRAVVLSVKHLHWHRGFGTSHPPAVLEILEQKTMRSGSLLLAVHMTDWLSTNLVQLDFQRWLGVGSVQSPSLHRSKPLAKCQQFIVNSPHIAGAYDLALAWSTGLAFDI
jgi:hypothetical protein